MIACTAAASVTLLLTEASAGEAANGGNALAGSLVGDLVGGAWALFPQFASVPASLTLDAP